jgi:uncharacterized membrane protein YbhN (UPF0104 family)
MFRDRRFIIGMLVSLGLLAWAMAKIDWAQVGAALLQARPLWLAAALVVYLSGYLWRCGRVSQILAPIKKVPARRVLAPLMVGFMFNNILPGRLGEVVLAWLLGRREGISKTAAFGAVVLSRILDGFTILSFFLFGLLAFLPLVRAGAPDAMLNLGSFTMSRQDLLGKVYLAGMLGVVVFGAVFVGCFFLIVWKDFTLKLVERALFFIPGTVTKKGLLALERFIGGLDILRHPGKLLAVFLLNFVPWSFEAATYLLVAHALGLDLTVRQICLVMGMANLALLVPALPGGIGLFEGAGLMVMVLGGMAGASQALSFMLLVHAIILVPINILGFWFLRREGLSFKDALARGKEA